MIWVRVEPLFGEMEQDELKDWGGCALFKEEQAQAVWKKLLTCRVGSEEVRYMENMESGLEGFLYCS